VVSVPSLSPVESAALFRAALAVAAADGVGVSELRTIFEQVELAGLPLDERHTALDALVAGASLKSSLRHMVTASEAVRCGALLALLAVALSDDVVVRQERQLLNEAASTLCIPAKQADALERFARTLGEAQIVSARDPVTATRTVKIATKVLTEAGVPIEALSVSGVIFGWASAESTGTKGGLVALGIGFTVVPGIGPVAVVGTAAYLGARWLMDRKKRPVGPWIDARRARIDRAIRNTEICLAHCRERARITALRELDAPHHEARRWDDRLSLLTALHQSLNQELRGAES